MQPGVDQSVIKNLKKKADAFTEKDKIFALLFDKMELKTRVFYNPITDQIDGFQDLGESGGRANRFADRALVFMLRGIYTKYKQPVAFYLVEDPVPSDILAKIIKTIIIHIHSTGCKVITTVCEHSASNIAALNLLKQKSDNIDEKNYFVLNDDKIFTIFDVPHLYKSICKNFLQAGEMTLEDKKAYWHHLVMAEEHNQNMDLGFAKIENMRLASEHQSNMNIDTAVTILSNTMANLLKVISMHNEDEKESLAILQTAEVVRQLDFLFDCSNGPASYEDIKTNSRTKVTPNSFHHEHWAKYKKMLKTVTFLKSNGKQKLTNARCVNCYIVTLSSIQDIWEYVTEKNLDYLNLRKLNLETLDNFFDMILLHSPKNRSPTCHHFLKAIVAVKRQWQ